MAKKFFLWLIIFLSISFVLQRFLLKNNEKANLPSEDIVLKVQNPETYLNESVVLEIFNNLDETLRFEDKCPLAPFRVEKYFNGVWQQFRSKEGKYLTCATKPAFFEIKPKQTFAIDYSPWKHEFFQELGKYRIVFDITVKDQQKSFATEFSLVERGFFSSIKYNVFYRPIFNLLVLLTAPFSNFGIGIVLLTILIRLLLLVPNQKALKSQRAMMKIQPQLEEIKRKYKGDQQKISLETMALWKQHKVNPIGGCLPLILQIPILIALFYVVKDGFNPYQTHLLYPFFSSFEITKISADFFGILDLQKVNATWLPVLVGGLQFIQMKMSFAKFKDKPQVSDTPSAEDPLKTMNKTMIYFMPIMILLMTASLPSGVGLYLAVSTIFGIVQQLFVNRAVC